MKSLGSGSLAVVAALSVGLAAPRAAAAQSQVRGRLHVVWDGEPTRDAPDGRRFFVVDDAGRATPLIPEPATRASAETLWRLTGRRVEVAAAPGAPARVNPGAVRLIGPAAAPAPTAATSDVVTILCRFADDTVPRFAPAAVELMMGATYPGMRQYYAEVSRDPAIMAGSVVTGWYTLPGTRATYVNGTFADFGALTTDCTAAADADVYFPAFRAVNLQFNGALSIRTTTPFDTLSFGGSWTVSADGVSRAYGMAWLSSTHARDYVVYTHELGHGFGWPHSSGDYGQEYDSNWDVMSSGYLRNEAPFGWLTIHTIAPHKRAAGWIADDRRWAPAWGRRERGRLVRSALPPGTDWLMIEIPTVPNTVLTAETRRVAGHDTPLPFEAVVLHRVTFGRAFVIDPDFNGNPNDAAAAWLPGETYEDTAHGLAISVDSAVADGFALTVTRGFRLRVTVAGLGVVTSDTGGISCPPVCISEPFDSSGVAVTLTASPAPDQLFAGWGGDCFGSTTCVVAMDAQRGIAATFPAPVVIASDSVRHGVMGAPYADTLRASGGPVGWRIVAGTLAPGLSVDSGSGRITGIPTASGTFAFTAEARTWFQASSRPLTLLVGTPLITAATIMDRLLGSSTALTDDEVRFLDLIGNRNGRLDIGDVRAWQRRTSGAAAAAAGARR